MRCLLVEDDVSHGQTLSTYLSRHGITVDRCVSLAHCQQSVPSATWDVVLLDLPLPDGDGLALISVVKRRAPRAAIIILTARDRVSDRIHALDAGADDYMVKPFDLDEMLARVRAVIRRQAAAHEEAFTLGDVHIDLQRHVVMRGGQEVMLTAKEWGLLRTMAARPEHLVSKEALHESLYGFDDDIGSNTLEVFVHNLRRKLGAEVIRTVRGVGYRLAARAASTVTGIDSGAAQR